MYNNDARNLFAVCGVATFVCASTYRAATCCAESWCASSVWHLLNYSKRTKPWTQVHRRGGYFLAPCQKTLIISSFQQKSDLKGENSKCPFKNLMRTVPRNIPILLHRSTIKTERKVCESLKSGPKYQVFWPKSGWKRKKSKFPFKDIMRTVPRNIPMKFHRSNLKTERQVHESLKSGPKF